MPFYSYIRPVIPIGAYYIHPPCTWKVAWNHLLIGACLSRLCHRCSIWLIPGIVASKAVCMLGNPYRLMSCWYWAWSMLEKHLGEMVISSWYITYTFTNSHRSGFFIVLRRSQCFWMINNLHLHWRLPCISGIAEFFYTHISVWFLLMIPLWMCMHDHQLCMFVTFPPESIDSYPFSKDVTGMTLHFITLYFFNGCFSFVTCFVL